MRAMSRLMYSGRDSLALSQGGLEGPWGDAADPELCSGQQQYRDWERERETLLDLIIEAEHDLRPHQYVGMQGPPLAMSLEATRVKLARLERLMAAHPEWRPE